MENVIHYGLESCQTVSYTKEHHQGLKKSVVSVKSSLPLISRLDSDIVKTLTNIQFGKVLGTSKLQKKLGNQWKWVFVLDHYSIEYSVVLYQPEETILFLDKRHWYSYRELGEVYSASMETLSKKLLSSDCSVSNSEYTLDDLDLALSTNRYQFNSMVLSPVVRKYVKVLFCKY